MNVFGPLRRRYALLLCSVTITLLLVAGGLETHFAYREARAHIEAMQEVQAQGAAREIATYLQSIEFSLRDVAKMPWGQPGFGPPERRVEFYRLMQLVPAIVEMQVVDAAGREQLLVSRKAPDQMESLRALDEPELIRVEAQTTILKGRTFFRDDHLPTIRISAFDGQGAMVATVDLRLLGEVVARLGAGDGGLAFIVDREGHLVAHPRPTDMIRRVDLSTSELVQRARAAGQGGGTLYRGLETVDMDGRPVIVTAVGISGSDWTVFMQQQRAEALKPALAIFRRTLALMVLGGLLALAASVVFARRMAAPIVALRSATARISRGDLDAELRVQRQDEIGDLAHDFNRMAMRLRELYGSLEAKVAQRTQQLSLARDTLESRAAEIAQLNERLVVQLDQLAQRKEEAERASSAKTRFLAAASHDLRQPMHSIGLLLGVLQHRLEQPSQQELVSKVQASVAVMEELFASLLDISKLDAGAVRPRFEAVDLGTILNRLAQTWAPQAAERGLRLRIRYTHTVIRADAAWLERIVGNLLSNALRYTKRGGVLVGCRRRGAMCELQVWDTGIGIDPKYWSSIFDEFFRIEVVGSGQENGLGLGLSIVQRGARLLGCTLSVDSRPGHGSVFRLSIPVVEEATAAIELQRHITGGNSIAGTFVAVVDDEELNRRALVEVLQAWDCHVVSSASTQGLVDALEEHLRVPDLVIADHRLAQGRTGLEAIDALRSQFDREMAALIVTADTNAELLSHAMRRGAKVLHKPVGLDRLYRAIRESLDARR